MTIATRKRFYKTATVAPGAPGPPGVFQVALDGRPLRTPAGGVLTVPSAALARSIAEEWEAQTDVIRPQTMPATSLVATAIDRVAPHRAAVIEQMVAYGASDLLCYRAEPGPLAARQHACWQWILDRAAARWGVRLAVTAGVMPIPQPPEALSALREVVEDHDDLELTALATVVPACGSLLLGLMLVEGSLAPDAAFEAAQLDQTYQIEQWGEETELMESRRRMRVELEAVARVVDMARERTMAARHG